MKKFICYDGVDKVVSYHDTEDAAVSKLKELISESLDCDDEWMNGAEYCLVAKLTHIIKPEAIKKVTEDDDEQEYTNMYIVSVSQEEVILEVIQALDEKHIFFSESTDRDMELECRKKSIIDRHEAKEGK